MNRILIDESIHHTRTAFVENGRLAELRCESKTNQSIVGNIYVGRIETVVPGMQSVFVQIGQAKNAYLYYGKVRAVTDQEKGKKPKQGEMILVQVTKDAVGTKGAVVTNKISLPGKFIVLLPMEAGQIGISQKIENPEERQRILQIIKELLPESYGIIVRTNGKEKTKDEFQNELIHLIERYEKVQQRASYANHPSLLYEEASPALWAVREYPLDSVDEFVVNDETIFQELQNSDFFTDSTTKLLYHERESTLFEDYFIESQAKKALEKKVWLKSGGFLVIEETEACVVIDVNTGKYTGRKDLQKTIWKTNAEAAEEIAWQLRLRNLSGIIIIDFIDMPSKEDQMALKKHLEQLTKKDRTKTMVIGMTELGLMQVTRKKTSPSLLSQMTIQCRSCHGMGRLLSLDWIVEQIRREVESIFINTIYDCVTIQADARLLHTFCGEKNKFCMTLEEKYGKQILCEPMEHSDFGYYDIIKGRTDV